MYTNVPAATALWSSVVAIIELLLVVATPLKAVVFATCVDGIPNSNSTKLFLSPGELNVSSFTNFNSVHSLSSNGLGSDSFLILAYASTFVPGGWYAVANTLKSSASNPSFKFTVLPIYFVSALPWDPCPLFHSFALSFPPKLL